MSRMSSTAAVVHLDHDPSAGSERFRPPGEDAPNWLAPVLAAIGTVLAVWTSDRLFGETAGPDAPALESRVALPVPPPDPMPSLAPAAAPTTTVAPQAPAVATASPSEAKPASPIEFVSPPPAEPSPAPSPEVTPPPSAMPVAAPVPVPAPIPAPVVAAPPAPCLPVVGIAFAHDSTKPIVDGQEAAVRPLKDWLREHPTAVLSVEGHADTIGTEDYNIVLSFGRARATIAWLGRIGLPEGQMAPRAAGTSQPKAQTGLASNRLVILQIEGVEVCRDTGGAAKKQ